MTDIRKLAIIGIGPRGGYALERFILELISHSKLKNIHLSLFESTGNFGNGPVYDKKQNSANWINITERILELERRKVVNLPTMNIPSFPSYHEWAGKDYSVIPKNANDPYPPRAQIGEYLSQRFQSFANPLIEAKLISLHEETVQEVAWLNGNFKLITQSNSYHDFDEVLLTIGHQLTELDQQISNWDKNVADSKSLKLFKTPYPISDYLYNESLTIDSSIGIRGFGLAMIDVTRTISEKFGRFITEDAVTLSCSFQLEQEADLTIVPFSLDGLPPCPKPLNALIDNWFKPSEEAIIAFEKKIGNKQIQRKAENPHFLISAFSTIASEIYIHLPKKQNTSHLSKEEIEKLICNWLKDQQFEHQLITPICQPAREMMQKFVDMATGTSAISLDFCNGQVWRHCQPSIYEKLSFNECSDSVFAEIIALDESTKRYSYGPPVESIQQLIALADAGVLNLDFATDPDIQLGEGGWELQLEGQSITTTIMIDSVLDSPQIKSVKSPIVKNLLEDDLIKIVHDDLGVKTDENGYLMAKKNQPQIPLALLGRLAKGTIIGVDAILECFGSRPRQWAKQAAQHHMEWLNRI